MDITRKLLSLALCFALFTTSGLMVFSANLTAMPTASTVLVNGQNVEFDAYLIEDNNYFKLRDLAYILNGTGKQFSVGFDGTIYLTSGQPYTIAGGEMEGKDGGTKIPTPTKSKIIKDGAEVQFTAYLIDGNNYFKLRDIGEAFNFGVDWDGAKNTIVIDTSKAYTGTTVFANKVPQNFTSGYESAVFSQYNSPASENGLGGAKIYLDCIIDSIRIMDTSEGKQIVAYLADSGGNNWITLLNATTFVNQNEYDSIVGKPVIFCGIYDGYSGTEKMPFVYLDELCVKETGEIKSGIGKLLSASVKPPENTYDFTKISEIERYLTETYPSVDTAMGTWKFEYWVYQSSTQEYSINVEYNNNWMYNLKYSDKYTETQRDEIKKQLKDFMKTIADDLLIKIENKKIKGCYHYSYYKYELIKEGYTSIKYCGWANYDWREGSKASVSTFRWVEEFDLEVW